jgi:hypothetical protein
MEKGKKRRKSEENGKKTRINEATNNHKNVIA